MVYFLLNACWDAGNAWEVVKKQNKLEHSPRKDFSLVTFDGCYGDTFLWIIQKRESTSYMMGQKYLIW